MKPLEKSGGLVDFKEKIIFENEKDSPFKSIKEFRAKIFQKYKYTTSSNLYREIINYQILKYGRSLVNDVIFMTKEDRIRLCDNNKKRRYMRRKGI